MLVVVVYTLCCGLLLWILRWLVKPFHARDSTITGLDGIKLRAVGGMNMILQKTIIFIGRVLHIDPCLLMNQLNLPTRKQQSITICGVKVFVYEPPSAIERNCVVYMHGGGFAYPHLFFYHWTLRKLCRWCDCKIFSIDYRLAPKFSYPAGHEDCHNVTKYILTHSEELRVKPNSIILCGDSAGGNLVAATCLRLCQRDTNLDYLPRGQYVDFDLPSYNDETYYTPLVPKYLASCFLSSFICGTSKKRQQLLQSILSEKRFSFSQAKDFLPDTSSKHRTDDEKQVLDILYCPFAFPLMAPSFPQHYPPAHILACKYDILYSDAVLFHNRLCGQGLQSTLYNYSTLHVAFAFAFLNLLESDRMFRDIAKICSKIFDE